MIRSQIPGGWATAEISEIGMQRTNTVDPSVYPDEVFELWSVPSFPTGLPEYLKGREIGSTKQEVRPGDVLLCKINPRINRVWQVGPEGTHRQIASTEWIVVRGDRLDPSFLQLALRAPEFREILCANVSGVGGSLTRARPSQVAKYRLPIAPLNEQRRIVAKIEALTARSRRAREALEAVPPLLEQLRHSVLAAAFSGRLTADWRARNPVFEPIEQVISRVRVARPRSGRDATIAVRPGLSALSVGMPNSQAPTGWRWVELAKVARLESGHTPSRKHPEYWDGPICWVGIKDARDSHGRLLKDTYQHITQLGLDNSAARMLPAGTVCLVRTAASIGYVTVLEREMATSQDLVNWICSEAVVPEYLMYLLIAEKPSILSFGKGSAHRTVYFPEIKAFHVCLPPVDEQREIVRLVKSQLASIARLTSFLENQNDNMSGFQQSILAKAFRGELVPQDPNDEPASVLLERIRAHRATAEADTKNKKSSRSSRLRGKKQSHKDAKTAKNSTTTDDPLQTVLHFLQSKPGPHSRTGILTHTNLDPTTWPTLAPQLNNHPKIHRTGEKRGTRYQWTKGDDE